MQNKGQKGKLENQKKIERGIGKRTPSITY